MELADWNFDAVADQNSRNLKDLEEGGTAEVWAAQRWILIGSGHPQEYYDLVQSSEASVNHGSVEIEKGGVFSAGSLTFSGISGGRGELEDHIAGFSKKKVLYS